jgi:hypothetical protein
MGSFKNGIALIFVKIAEVSIFLQIFGLNSIESQLLQIITAY